ncbi:2-phosphosulfolactate phosphatase [Mahella australiensis]|uniref:Probable 2-phosphosulfolactate phosphatase n=1 Tax=Mahella australiensis (strain DSM 15567 / CIP 107919 / 50-1 BON) TaxID=697281 RepID=F3ZWD4_MAHA5|nr:2-phosphosulfolactate phosphatase [Mahella australiensis]AEE97543.1 2-phosphosulfolactate phosphatase [Mahella australiensis 50-1 BON]
MNLSVFATENSILEKELKGRVAVVIDVLRATSTIVTALANGCKEVIPVMEIEEAVNMAKNYDKNMFLLAGERGTVGINGFHLSNSPLEYTEETVKDKTIIITTTNGTRAIRRAYEAAEVVIGCMLNAAAVAKHLCQENKDVVILCAGTDGKFSLDDVVTAGMVVSYICRNKEEVELDDLALTSRYIYELNKSDLNRLLSHTYHYGKLMEAGFEEDIKYCLKNDVIDLVPHYENGIIRNKGNR